MKVILLMGMVFGFSLLSCVDGSYANTRDGHSVISLISLKLDADKVDDLVQDISKQTNHTIHIEESLRGEIVSGDFVEVSIEQFFHRIFKQKNIVVDIDTYGKIVVVRQFGGSMELSNITESSLNPQVALSNVRMSELEDIFSKEDDIYQAWRRQADAIVPFSDVTKKEYDEFILLEAIAYEVEKQDATRIVALSNVTQLEAQEIFESEEARGLLVRQDTKSNIALSNMTHTEFMEGIVVREYVNNNSSQTVPFSTVTYSEFQMSKE
ncbi:MAG: hypothetical protein JKY62_07355 [Desulfocapsa sp.]|nr:hypothetical protein [Desulfocapsa sp.]